MVRISSVLLQALNTQYSYTNGTTTTTSSTSTNTPTFAAVLTQLNKNINETSSASDILSSSPVFSSTDTTTSNNPTSSIVSLIVQKVKDKSKDSLNGEVDIESILKQYLSDNYSSKSSVISAISGYSDLPNQVTQMEDSIYNQIVAKLTSQVREKLYEKNNISSLYSDDDTSTESDTPDTDFSDISFY